MANTAVVEKPSNVPDHVPDELIFDFDIYADPRITDDVQDSYAEALKDAPDIFYTPANGGHWMVRRHDAITKVVLDPEHFSAREMQIPRVDHPPKMIPLNLDPPENVPYRKALMAQFGNKAIKALEPRIRDWAVRIIEPVVEKGECDFIEEVSSIFPVSVFMELMGMDLSRLREFRLLADEFFNAHDTESIDGLSAQILGMLKQLIDRKQAAPGDDLVSHLLAADVDGRAMSEDEVLAMGFVLFLGGMDTVTNVAGFTFKKLAERPDLQARLAADPSLIPAFVDEGIRSYGVVNTPRLVVREQSVDGVVFKPGDMVLCLLPMGSRDDRRFDDPNSFDIDRPRQAHLTFSTGPHLCVGHILGRSEIRILVEEWLKRIPAFRRAGAERHGYRIGTVMAIESLPLSWRDE